MRKEKKFERIVDGDTPGVCMGLSEYFNIDVVIIRLLFIIGFLLGWETVLLYIILWILTPEKK